MKLIDITEARKNPEQNPKTPINKIIKDKLTATKDKFGPVKNLFISFTELDKLGVNPKSKHGTPLGIYAYPAQYVVDLTGTDEVMGSLPYVGDQPYVNIFKAKGNIIELSTITDSEVNQYYRKLGEVWAKYSGSTWKTSVDQIDELVRAAQSYAHMKSLPGGQLWYVTNRLAMWLKDKLGPWGTSHIIAWNKLFRLIGIDGAIDNGTGIIHTNEYTQAVFFSIGAIGSSSRHLNKYSPDALYPSQLKRDKLLGLQQKYSQMSEEQKIQDMSVRPTYVRYINKPSVAVQVAAMTAACTDSFSVTQVIKALKNPCKEALDVLLQPNHRQFIIPYVLIRNKRWLEAEPIIKQYPDVWPDYIENFGGE
jgi:hypothetical protein